MASDNETVAEIMKRVRRDCNSCPLPTAAAEMFKLVREIDEAHRREVAELQRRLKVAEDALAGALSAIDEFMTRTIYRVHGAEIGEWKAALAAIREEGGAQ